MSSYTVSTITLSSRRRILLDACFDDCSNKFQRYRFVERKAQVTLRAFVACERLIKPRIARDGWEHPDMTLKRREVNQHVVPSEGGHAVTDDLFGVGCGFPDDRADFAERCSDRGRRCVNVAIDR